MLSVNFSNNLVSVIIIATYSCNGHEIIKIGSYETGYQEDDNNTVASDLPKVIGIVRKN